MLLHGPVGSSKSTIARLLKRGLEDYSQTDQGMLFSFAWKNPDGSWAKDPMHGDPLQLIPTEQRARFLAKMNEGRKEDEYHVRIKGDLCPYSRYIFNERLAKYNGDWTAMLANEIKVYRLVLAEKDRIGIGTFQPKDEKNQDSTELTGDINYRKIAEYGTDSDPRAFNFDGELNIANRGLVEFIEVLKLDVAFLYDLLGASQEHKIKPKKFAQTDIDEVILGHTNEPEYRRLQNNEFMEALRDRTVKIDVPYVTRLKDEIRIYEKDFNTDRVKGKHIAPHTIEIAAMWAVLTRLVQPKHANLTLLQKLKLYNGKTLPGLHRGQRRRAEARGGQRGDARHQPALHPGQDLQRHRRPPRRGQRQPVHGAARTGSGAAAPLADHQPGAVAALPRAAGGGHARSTRTSSRTRCSGPSPPTRTPCSGCAPTTSTTCGRTRSARRCATATRATTRSPTSG